MPPTPTKTLSPAELAKLEHAFATDPASEAYHPLAEAYLGMGRFMEAMVVCKKGVKAHPSKPDPRVLLARVYAEQGKDKKALEELAGAIGVAPNDKLVLRMTGALQLKSGEADVGKRQVFMAPASRSVNLPFVGPRQFRPSLTHLYRSSICRASFGGVAQLGERRVRNAKVVGSIPSASTRSFQAPSVFSRWGLGAQSAGFSKVSKTCPESEAIPASIFFTASRRSSPLTML